MKALLEVAAGDGDPDDYPPDEIECSSGTDCLGLWEDHQGNPRAASIGWVFTSTEDTYGREIEGLAWNTIWTDPTDPTVRLCEDCADRHDNPDSYDAAGSYIPEARTAYRVVVSRGGNVLRDDTVDRLIEADSDYHAPFVYNAEETARYWADNLAYTIGKGYTVTVVAEPMP